MHENEDEIIDAEILSEEEGNAEGMSSTVESEQQGGHNLAPLADGSSEVPNPEPGEAPTIPFKRFWVPTVLAAVAGLLALISGFVALGKDLGLLLALPTFLGGAMALGASFFFRRELNTEEFEVAREREALEELRDRVEDGMVSFEKKRQRFEDRLLTYGEWMEFPEALSFGDRESDETEVPKTSEGEEAPEEQAARDRQVAVLVQSKSEEILAKFREDAFSEKGKLQPRLLLMELLDFVEEIALIYRPDSENPLLETSVERILKGVNRMSLQLLFHLEQLPLNLKDYNLATAYDHIRTASRLQGYYKTVSPYLPIANYTWHLGKLLAGTNPLTAGTWFLGSEVLRRGGKKLSKRFVEHHSLRLTAETMRILGNEAALLFDEDYRYREPGWIYGVELVDLVHRFPLSRETLQSALDEVGRLTLRSSYDRVFLYRCLAAHASSKAEKFTRAELLRDSERRDIARQLEKFFEKHVHGRQPEEVDRWRLEVSERLGVALRIKGGARSLGEAEQMSSALESLASYLRSIKEMETTAEIAAALEGASLAEDCEPEELGAISVQAAEFFEYPDLDPGSDILKRWFKDLLYLEKTSGKVDLRSAHALRTAAEYFRMPSAPIEKAVERSSQELLGREIEDGSPESSVPRELLFGLGGLLAKDEWPIFFYPSEPVALPSDPNQGDDQGDLLLPDSKWWLVGTATRLYLLAVDLDAEEGEPGRIALLWTAERGGPESVRLERGKNVVTSAGLLYGGQWHLPGDETPPRVRLRGPRLGRYEKYFRSLIRWTEHAID